VQGDDFVAEDVVSWNGFWLAVWSFGEAGCVEERGGGRGRDCIPGARLLGTVVVQELLLAIRSAAAQTWVLKLMPAWSILTNLRVFLLTLACC
jgi:hypothetical protein